jgi:hypothetical protein
VTAGLHLDSELADVVERARRLAAKTGEWPREAIQPFGSTIPTEAADVMSAWLRDGGYDEAVARVAAEDPDLATQ